MVEKISIETPVQFSDPLPEAVDVAIIGGGVIGIFASLYLARAGKKVCVLEKGRISAEQSSRNWGWIRQHERDEAEVPIAMEALRLWKEADSEVGGATGFVNTPINYLASSEKERAGLEGWMAIAEKYGVNSVRLSKKQIADLFGGLSNSQWVGGTSTLDDARAEPWEAIPAIARLAHQQGVTIIENCAARSLEIAAGQVAGLHTEQGLVKCQQVVLAAGAWSLLFARKHGISFPQLSVNLTAMQTAPMQNFTEHNSADEDFAIRRRNDGGYTLAVCDGNDFFIGPDAFRNFFKYVPLLKESWDHTYLNPMAPKNFPDAWTTKRSWADDETTPFERCRVLEPAPNMKYVRKAISAFEKRFPTLGKPQILDSWAGMVDAMPDVVPLIDTISALPGLVVATGFSGHGFGFGPGAAMIVRDLILGNKPTHDISRFRYTRFSDGSPMLLGPAL
ncbi:FAD-binding oxidoreductase [uncultured Cohaesibacter sp.]|uniref:NAD(P)/FAD-dependent oxidoreductase n=1 Tax=uncultured Cohaesibacter sp. TaxID=1002546 RepID=UPI0029C93600|nr:FAD-binding oxidoreductase [uncultured Cohaesibacter sp.]